MKPPVEGESAETSRLLPVPEIEGALMPEMAYSGENHRHLAFVRCSNDFLVADGATRLNGGGCAGVRRRN